LSELVAFFIGGFAGMLILGIFAVDSYQKGYEDGYEKGTKKATNRAKRRGSENNVYYSS
jgi:hypothetical protein